MCIKWDVISTLYEREWRNSISLYTIHDKEKNNNEKWIIDQIRDGEFSLCMFSVQRTTYAMLQFNIFNLHYTMPRAWTWFFVGLHHLNESNPFFSLDEIVGMKGTRSKDHFHWYLWSMSSILHLQLNLQSILGIHVVLLNCVCTKPPSNKTITVDVRVFFLRCKCKNTPFFL